MSIFASSMSLVIANFRDFIACIMDWYLGKRPVNQQLPVQSFDQFHGMSSSILLILWSAT